MCDITKQAPAEKISAGTVLDFWFGPDQSEKALLTRKTLWFIANADTDNTIRDQFEPHISAALNGHYSDWCQTAPGRLALILLLDQFTRNVYRKNPDAFSGDALARDICVSGIAEEHDRLLTIPERSFYYMPLEHSESLEDQDKSVQLFAKLVEQSTSEHQSLAENAYRYAEQHRNIIQRFGRFPHRNSVLKRESTAEEIDYLKQNGIRFGQ